jgi:hypothetical protein
LPSGTDKKLHCVHRDVEQTPNCYIGRSSQVIRITLGIIRRSDAWKKFLNGVRQLALMDPAMSIFPGHGSAGVFQQESACQAIETYHVHKTPSPWAVARVILPSSLSSNRLASL